MNESDIRKRIVSEAHFWVNNQALTHYAEVRPIPIDRIKRHLQNDTDCSGWIIGVYAAAGAPDPSGNNYSGAGNTDSFVDHMHSIRQNELQAGDVVEFAGHDTPKAHASLVIEAGDDPLMASNGFDGGPIVIRLSQEIAERKAAGNGVKPIFYLTMFNPAVTPKVKRFTIYVDGTVVAHTNRWRTWAIRHRPFAHGATNFRVHKRN